LILEAVGWTKQRQAGFDDYASDGLMPGRVVGEHRTHLQVATAVGELSAEMSGRLRKGAAQRSDLPGVGDFVALRPSAGDGPATIEVVLPRTSALIRMAAGEHRPQLLAANVDVAFIVTGLDGDFNLQRLERYLALVRDSSAEPVIVANKIDLSDNVAAAASQISEIARGVPILAISARAAADVGKLETYLDGNRTVVFIGSSGVGKSTLTNQLLGRAAQATQDVRSHDSRGRHTTTHRQLFTRPQGGAIIDTPGIRGLELWNAAGASDPSYADDFADVEALAAQCRFRDCRHVSEPACAVRAAVARGELDAAHLANYAKRGVAVHSRSR
jgi:ribosome biogenesis GTPase / thiamine phosphate phosphatase